MAERSLARRGLDMLLAAYPNADVLAIDNQRASTTWVAWTCVDLALANQPLEPTVGMFAIWNATGAVYKVEDDQGGYPGAVQDDPFLTLPEEIKCPGCELRLPADNVRAQVEHMQAAHSEIVDQRRCDAGFVFEGGRWIDMLAGSDG